jgi:imidazolonepropionase-like amidohydrolase
MLVAARSLLLAGLVASSALRGAEGDTLVLRNATVLDGVHSEPRLRATIVIRNGRIAGIGGPSLQASGKAIDLDGKWLMPGLIDAHVHLHVGRADEENAKRALFSGITTVRSMGSGEYADVDLRTLHRNGRADIPDVLASGYQLTHQRNEALLASQPNIRALFDQTRFADAMMAILNLMPVRAST